MLEKKASIRCWPLVVGIVLWGVLIDGGWNAGRADQRYRMEKEDGVVTLEVKNEAAPGEPFLVVWYLTKAFGEPSYVSNSFLYTGIDGSNTLHVRRILTSDRREGKEVRVEPSIPLNFKLQRAKKTDITLYVNIPDFDPILLRVKEIPHGKIGIEYLNPPASSEIPRTQ